MALNVKAGTFDISSTAGVSDQLQVTGVGFEPKIVILFWSGTTRTSAGAQAEDISFGWGAFVSGSSRFMVGGASNDDSATMASARFQHNLRAMKFHANGSTTEAGGLDGWSMDSDGFTLVYDVVFASSIKCHYIALGGADLTNYKLATRGVATTTGNYSVTGVGFQPDALLVFCSSVNAAANQASDTIFSMGFTDGTNQAVIAFQDDNGTASSETDGYSYSGELIAASSSANTINIREALVSFDSDGFTMNHIEGTSSYVYHYIALKGGQYKVGTLNTRTDTNDIAITGVGFTPEAILFASSVRAQSTQDTLTANAALSFGAATSESERVACGVWSEDGLADSETSAGYHDAAVYMNVRDDAVAALMDLKSKESDGFTCVMDTVEPTAASQVMWLAIGAADGSLPVPVFYHHLQTQGIA